MERHGDLFLKERSVYVASPYLRVTASPRLPFSPSPLLRVTASPRLPFSPSPRPRVTASPCPRISQVVTSTHRFVSFETRAASSTSCVR